MKAVLQLLGRASVRVMDETVGQIGPGLMVLVCAMEGDDDARADALAEKAAKLRIFRDEQGRMNRSLLDTGGEVLVVSQFTLAADTSRGNRPGFSRAAAPAEGERLYLRFSERLRQLGLSVETGRFGADMAVELVNDGPVTIWLEA